MADFEQLGAFYLGRLHDLDTDETRDEDLLYDAKDLTTHALCVGMTGSGKTGLCVSLLEEAALDGIPALVIDPKGDLGNLLLTFPELRPEDFAPWVDPAEAVREGLTTDELAARTATRWREGLARWGQDGERIRRLREAADAVIYTPGSSAGVPLQVLRSFTAPPDRGRDDPEAFADRVQGAVTALLGLLGIDADPVQSREAILLANVLQAAWSAGRDLELGDLVREVQAPPFERLGVIDLETFYPAKDRARLALALNALLASPGFARWVEGEPLDVARLLHTDEGRPRLAILSLAHLSDAERMFFVTLLLNEVVTWMRRQTGTGSLRAILYMDEIFGYFPPTAEPPSKRPMLTLLKQARAYGLGCVLATQNPVDLDYKGLANTGTWFIGRLQTERDKARVLDGLEGAMTGGGRTFDRAELDRRLSSLGKRVFLLNNVHEDGPVTFHTRWAMSYLRGPLSREHVRRLTEPTESARPTSAPPTSAPPLTSPPASDRPVLPPEVREVFLPARPRPTTRLVYRPALVARARLHYANARAGVDEWRELSVRAPLDDDEPPVDWAAATIEETGEPLPADGEPVPEAAFAALPSPAARATSYRRWQKELESHLYRTRPLTLLKSRPYRLVSRPDESPREFRVRVTQAAHEKRDALLEKLRKRYAPKLARLQERIRKAEERVGREEEQYREKRTGSLISAGTTLLGALFGRKLASSTNVRRAGSTARSLGRVSKEKADIERAQRDLAALEEQLAELEADFEEQLEELRAPLRPEELELEEVVVRPRKADIDTTPLALAWTPWHVDADGLAEPAS